MTTTSRDVLADLNNALAENEILAESLADAKLALEDRGWDSIGGLTGVDEFDKGYLTKAARQCRASAVINPLIGRAINLRISYIWGGGVTIGAATDDDGGQDVNAVVQAFLDDPSNRAAFTSGQAREELERALATDGNVFLALVTSPLTGRVQVRSVPFTEVDDVILNPEDRDDAWFIRRTYTVDDLTPSLTGMTTTTRTTPVYHPVVGHRPAARPRQIDGHEVRWDAPILHVTVNRLDGWKYGIGDVYPALPWARGYSEFLQDWARLMKALSRIAYQVTAKNGRGAAQTRSQFSTAGEAGQTAVTGLDLKVEAVNKSGATIDANSGRPLASLVASAVDLPVTLLLADPGVTGARAVAETLDKPTHLIMGMRRSLWADVFRAVLDHVIDSAVLAPKGQLRGTLRTDPATGLRDVVLLGDQDRGLTVDWPDLDETDPSVLVEAIVKANDTATLPPDLVARLLMQVLDVDNIDELLATLLDDNGDWIGPTARQDAAVARAALDAFADGRDPAATVTPQE